VYALRVGNSSEILKLGTWKVEMQKRDIIGGTVGKRETRRQGDRT
jgi:hypothetical protein